MATETVYTTGHARRVLEVVDAGLCKGLGFPEPGEMCVEAAVSYALGLPHGDDPGCVNRAVRQFKIRLNDAMWSSNVARAKGLRALAVAQLGSKDAIDGREFARRLAEKIIRVLVPIALRAAAECVPSHAAVLGAAAGECERVGTRGSANAACKVANSAAAAAAAAYAADAADAAATAAYAAYAADADADADAYAYAADADADAAVVVAYAAAAYAADAAAADAAVVVAYAGRDRILSLGAQLAFDVLRELNAPGVALWDALNAGDSRGTRN